HRWVGQLPRDEVRCLYGISDVFAFPSRIEGSALVTYEAMASALPVVTTVQSGSVVRDGVDGFLIEPRDVAALKMRLRVLHDDPQLRRTYGESGRRLIVSQYTWAHYRQRIATFYESLIGEARAA
ncbi:MAG: glycosyltransferase, partial [Gaiellaceae bacterium]